MTVIMASAAADQVPDDFRALSRDVFAPAEDGRESSKERRLAGYQLKIE